MISVDFPIPGSPNQCQRTPYQPSPRTRFSSPIFVSTCFELSIGLRKLYCDLLSCADRRLILSRASSLFLPLWYSMRRKYTAQPTSGSHCRIPDKQNRSCFLDHCSLFRNIQACKTRPSSLSFSRKAHYTDAQRSFCRFETTDLHSWNHYLLGQMR